MDWLSIVLGLLLGGGVLVAWIGFRGLQTADRSEDLGARRKAFWKLNIGLVMIAASLIVMMQLSGSGV